MEEIKILLENLTSKSDKIGLYLIDVNVVSNGEPEDLEKVKNSEISLKDFLDDNKIALICQFQLGDVAYSDRVQNPEKFDLDKEFMNLVPSKQELAVDKIKDKLLSSDDLMSLFDEEL
jgi:hypothetical protein